MIALSHTTAFMVYLGLTLGTLLLLWIYQHYQSKNRPIISSEKTLCICEYCHFAYMDESDKNVTKCPQCQSFNKNIKK